MGVEGARGGSPFALLSIPTISYESVIIPAEEISSLGP
jgi:hypothetical protein